MQQRLRTAAPPDVGKEPQKEALRAEIDELASSAYGPNVQLVVTCASGQVDRLTRNHAGRDASRLGRTATVLELDDLDG